MIQNVSLVVYQREASSISLRTYEKSQIKILKQHLTAVKNVKQTELIFTKVRIFILQSTPTAAELATQ